MDLVKWYEIFFDPLTESEEYKRAEESRTSDIELEAEGDEIDLSSTNPLNQDLPVSGVVTNLIIQFEKQSWKGWVLSRRNMVLSSSGWAKLLI